MYPRRHSNRSHRNKFVIRSELCKKTESGSKKSALCACEDDVSKVVMFCS